MPHLDDIPDTLRRRRRPGRWRRGLLAGTIAAITLAAGACGGDADGTGSGGVASVDVTTAQPTSAGSDAPSSAPSADAEPDPVAYANCMRANGVPGFPDPESNGDFAVDSSELGVAPDSEQYKQAESTCAPLLPTRSASQKQEDYEARLEYAQCMRDEGITAFPDPPVPSDGPNTQSGSAQQPANPGFDLDSPQFKAAQDACKDKLPSGDSGPSLSGS